MKIQEQREEELLKEISALRIENNNLLAKLIASEKTLHNEENQRSELNKKLSEQIQMNA